LGDGYVSLLLPLYLLELGFSPLQVGIIATATLLGSGLLTLLPSGRPRPASPRFHAASRRRQAQFWRDIC
jgi:hypothetical protein